MTSTISPLPASSRCWRRSTASTLLKGASFEQYAWTRVAGALVDELRRQDWASRSVRREGRRIEQARDAFLRETRRSCRPRRSSRPSSAPPSTRCAAALEDIERSDVASLNAPARGADDAAPVEIGETIQAPEGGHEPENTALGADRSARCGRRSRSSRSASGTSSRSSTCRSSPEREVGRMLGVSESRVSQILSGIRGKLQHQLATYDTAAAA